MSSKNKTAKTNKKSKSNSSKQNPPKCKSYLPSTSATKPSPPDAAQEKKLKSQKPLKKILKTKKQTLLLRESCGYITVTPVAKSSKRKKKTSHKTVTFNENVDINIIPNDKSVSSESECDSQEARKKKLLGVNSEKQRNKSEDDSTEIYEIGDEKTLIDILKGNPNHISNARLLRMKWRISGNSTLQTTEKDDSFSTFDMTRLRSGFQLNEFKDLMESEKEEKSRNDIKTEQLNVAEDIFRRNLNRSPKYRYADLTPMEKEYLVPFKIPSGFHSELKQKGTVRVIKKQEEKSKVAKNFIRNQGKERKLPEKIIKPIHQEPQETSCESPVKDVIKNVDKDLTKGLGTDLTKGVIKGISVGASGSEIESVTKDAIKIAIRGVIKGDLGRVVGGAAGRAVGDAVEGAIGGVVGSAVEGAVGGAVEGAFGGAVRDAVAGTIGGALGGAVRDAVAGTIGGAVGGAFGGAVDGAVGGAVGGTVGGTVDGAVGGAIGSVVGGAIEGAVGGAIGGVNNGIRENIAESTTKDNTARATKGSSKNIAGGKSNVKIFCDSIIDDPLVKARNDLLDILILHETLSKEYDVNFAKLRYIQLLCKESHDACHDPLIKKILNVYELIDCQDESDNENLSEEENI